MKAMRFGVWLKVLVLVFSGWASTAQAAVIGTAAHLQATPTPAEVAQLRESVEQQLVRLGVTNEDALARVAALSRDELQLLAEKIDELPAGGIAATLGVVFIVLLILELVGITDIFTAI